MNARRAHRHRAAERAVSISLVAGPRVPSWPFAAVVLLAVAGSWIAWIATTRPSTVLCNVKHLTGLPCPTCGSTRAVLAAARGDWIAAFAHNPLVTTLGVCALLALVVRLVGGRTVRVELRGRTATTLAWSLAVAAVAANLAYLIATGR